MEQKSKISKQMSTLVGRTFNLLFTRATMYNMDHPSAQQSLVEFYKTITEGLNVFSPLVLIMAREQFFIEDEPMDPRINTSKMVTHFKKANIQSVSFEKGLRDAEVDSFIRVFTDLNEFPTAGDMQKALTKRGILNIKINHVIYKKMTTDEAIVSKEKLKKGEFVGGGGEKSSLDVLIEKMLSEGVLLEELEKSLSLKNLMENPSQFSKALIDTDVSNAQRSQTGEAQPGALLPLQLRKVREKLDQAVSTKKEINLAELAESVFAMRKELLEGLEAQKAMGILFADEEKIREEADELADQIVIRLVTEEYKKGAISVKRLAQLLRRIIPETKDLRRLLPKLKEALLAEGMPLGDFLLLIQEMGKEFQSEELAQILQKSAEEIGLTGEALIQEIKGNPTEAAELIFLASEIRKGEGDENVLTEILVEYIERIGCEMALDSAEEKGEEGGKHIRDVIANIETELVDRLRKKDVKSDVLSAVEKSLKERMEDLTSQLKSSWVLRQIPSSGAGEMNEAAIRGPLEESVDTEEELQAVLQKVLVTLQNRGVDESKLQRIYDDILERKTAHRKAASKKTADEEAEETEKGMPKGAFNRGTFLFFLKKELARARRYKTPFSTLTFAIVKASPKVPVVPGSIKRNEILNEVLKRLVKIVRDIDLIGVLDENRICALMPMTPESGSKVAHRRILRAFHSEPFTLKDIPLQVKLAAVSTAFHRDRTPTMQAFVKAIEVEMNELMKPVKSWFILDKMRE